MCEREVLGGSQVNAIDQVVPSMGELVRASMLKGVTEEVLTMEREADHELKVGLEVRREV